MPLETTEKNRETIITLGNERRELFIRIVQEFTLNLKGIHGFYHWARVLENGLRLSEINGADKEVVILFALFHDSKRESEGYDPKHGKRGALFSEQLRNRNFKLSDDAFEKLIYACEYHSKGLVDSDVTIQTCWDADRLDLGRVGIVPKKQYLSPMISKYQEILEGAIQRGTSFQICKTAHLWEKALK